MFLWLVFWDLRSQPDNMFAAASLWGLHPLWPFLMWWELPFALGWPEGKVLGLPLSLFHLTAAWLPPTNIFPLNLLHRTHSPTSSPISILTSKREYLFSGQPYSSYMLVIQTSENTLACFPFSWLPTFFLCLPLFGILDKVQSWKFSANLWKSRDPSFLNFLE